MRANGSGAGPAVGERASEESFSENEKGRGSRYCGDCEI